MNCPSCGAPLRLKDETDCLVCDYCGSVHVPEPNSEGVRILEVAAEESCPVCHVPLVHAAIAGHRIRYCRQCHGMLVLMDRLVEIEEDLRARRDSRFASPQRPDPRDLNRRIPCPQCGRQMDTHPYQGPGNVIIDSCESCALDWLDYGELERMVRAPDREYIE